MWSYVLLYVLPLTARFMLTEPLEPTRILLSLIPLVIVFPSTLLPRFIESEETEHTVRHAVYATSFTVAVGTSIRWDVVRDAYPEHVWPLYLFLFAVGGVLTLWWFVLAHAIENRYRLLYTHQGDVTVLPLTLVAIATFVYDVPDDAFQFSRSILFYVPVVVAWATLHFVAFNGFAQTRTTTHSVEGFGFLAEAGLVVAVAHLALIELRATPVAFIALPFVSSLLSQTATRPEDRPLLRPWRGPGMGALQVGLSIAFAQLLKLRFDSDRVTLANAVLGATFTAVVPTLCGNRWVWPATLYATLLAAAYAASDPHIEADVRAGDIVALAAQFYLVFQITHLLAAPQEIQPLPPGPAPRHLEDTPQRDRSGQCFHGTALALLDRIPVPSCRRHGDATIRAMLKDLDPSCPEVFAGVWWMRGTSYPMQLTTVHGHTWRRSGERWTSTFSLRTGTRSASVAGAVNLLAQSLCITEVQWSTTDRWIRTPGWVLPLLRLLPDTYWLYRHGEDEMLRIVFDHRGRIVWQYRMLRIVRGDGRRTRFCEEFLRDYDGVPCLLG